MAREILPGGELAVEILFVGVRKRAEGEIPIVGVAAVEGEMVILFGGGFKQGGVFETVTEAESAVVMEIVAEELVGGGSLLDDGFEGGMRIERGHDGGPSVLRRSGDGGAGGVVGGVFWSGR